MKRRSQNAILIFASLFFALALGFHALAVSSQAQPHSNPSRFQADFSEETSISNPDDLASTTAILDSRRTIPQTFFRGQRFLPSPQADGRYTASLHKLFILHGKRLSFPKEARIPTPQVSYCTPKAYYVFALERILC